MQAAALELERVLHGDIVGASDISRLLGGMVEKLQVLKRKVRTCCWKGTCIKWRQDNVPWDLYTGNIIYGELGSSVIWR